LRTSISAKSGTDLHAKIDELLRAPSGGGNAQSIGIRSKALSNPIRALGVFTGQGAQWPTMDRELVLNSPYVQRNCPGIGYDASEVTQTGATWVVTDG
jgi:hybrid polyketide synthase / nonribosomal peptide synthetase ACE1